MNIYDYIDKYGNKTFYEEEFNEIDAVLFSYLSYADLEGVITSKDKLTIEQITEKQKDLIKKDRNILAVKDANKLLNYIYKTNRYKDCLIYNYEYIGNTDIQFGVFSIEYLPNKVYVSFEGTDQLFSGWIEDFILSYKYPTISHKKAIKYLNKHYTFSFKELIVGGHSKGGNLALVSSMNANIFVRNKIKKIYNADGPGLLEKQLKSRKYKSISNRYIHIMPESSYVGLFLEHSNDYVVASTNNTILSHLIGCWKINDKKFIKTELNPMAKELDKGIKEFLKKYDEVDKYNFVNNLDNILRKANVTSMLELRDSKTKIISLIKESKDISKESKVILNDFINIMINCFKTTKKEEFKGFINSILKKKNEE